MPLDVAAIQQTLRADGLDGWLLYDFHGSNPIAAGLAGLNGGGHMTTRRWYYLIPAQGEPRGVVHAIERHNLDGLPGPKIVYAGREELEAALTRLLEGRSTIAMEYSPEGAIPYLSRVDAGTAEAVRRRGVEIVSSGDLVQRFEAAWNADQLASHQAASEALYRIKDRAFAAAAAAVHTEKPLTEYGLQQQMVKWFEEEGLVSDSAPVVAIGPNAGNPHYLPAASGSRPIVADQVLLLDLWGKQSRQARCLLTSPGLALQEQPCRKSQPGRSALLPRRGTPRQRWWPTPPPQAATCEDGKWTGRRGRCSNGPATANRSCIGPGIALAKACTATACTWTTTRRTTTAGSCPGPALPLSQGSISRHLAFAPRSTCFATNTRRA